MRGAALAAVICALAGCTTFEDPSIVLDLRILAVTATELDRDLKPAQSQAPFAGPEQVVDVDLLHPNVADILAQLHSTQIEAIVADPGAHRGLRWKMTLCLLTLDERCDPDHPTIELGSAMIDDPDDSPTAQRPSAYLTPDQKLLAILKEALDANPVQALGGVEYGVIVEIDDPADPNAFAYAAKHLRIAGKYPPRRAPNLNPYIQYLDAAVMGAGILIPTCRCSDTCLLDESHPELGDRFPRVQRGKSVTLFPVEPPDAREDYVAPTLDGGSAVVHETVTYQWLAAQGSFSDETTGGGHDLLGNQSLLGTEWRSPRDVTAPTLVPLWVIQRDERYGVNVIETCLRVTP